MPVKKEIGESKHLSVIIGDAGPLLDQPYFFPLAVWAGIDTVWIRGGSFLGLEKGQKQAILDRASRSGLQTVGFIDGDPAWLRENSAAVRHYEDLLEDLAGLDWKDLRVAFGIHLELSDSTGRSRPPGWDGDFGPYMELIEGVVMPKLTDFAQAHRHPGGGSIVESPFLTRFEPWWYKNGHVMEDGTVVRGFRPVPLTQIAAMTYQNTADDVEIASRPVRERAAQEQSAFQIGVTAVTATRPGSASFIGKEEMIGRVFVKVHQKFASTDRARFSGFFMQTDNPDEGYRLLSILVHRKPMLPVQPRGRPSRAVTD